MNKSLPACGDFATLVDKHLSMSNVRWTPMAGNPIVLSLLLAAGRERVA